MNSSGGVFGAVLWLFATGCAATDGDEPPEEAESTTSGSPATGTGTTVVDPPTSSDPGTGSSSSASTGPSESTDASSTGGSQGGSPGCGVEPNTDWLEPYKLLSGGQAQRGVVDAAGMEREYLIDVPPDYDENQRYPVVFNFHGAGHDMDEAYLEGVAALWGDEVVSISPQGIDDVWASAGDQRDVSFFTSMLQEVGTELCVDLERIFVSGWSNGAAMAHRLACERSDLVAGSGAAAGSFPAGLEECGDPVAQFIVHGVNDNPVSGQDARDRWLGINGCEDSPSELAGFPCDVYEACDAPVIYCEHTGGHDKALMHDLDAPMMDFFAAQ